MTQYDNIAEQYSKSQEEKPERKFLFDPSFMDAIGNLKNKKVLDLACGSGYYTRKIKLAGAKEVVGVDISSKMIALAKKQESSHPLGIRYIKEGVAEMKKIGDFDIVTAGFLLHYAKSKEELSKMCKNIYKNLKKGGYFVTLTNNPFHPICTPKKYNVLIEGQMPVKEGTKLEFFLFDKKGNKIGPFGFYQWSPKTYELIFRGEGFTKIEWIKLKASEEGNSVMGKEHWRDFYKAPFAIILKARK